ncbi:uncharacterized protein RAG0_06810 [Rhynchosporium agropyri]|uniref:PLC-like phosphodiesterase n=1 Tax=Rhynchosporium agropyri TaxID=914238 RepID=A0A1E1KIV9_9HELO|nr:uncharacterized protein RAG0_06810 [Rhynchosporium agropyri]
MSMLAFLWLVTLLSTCYASPPFIAAPALLERNTLNHLKTPHAGPSSFVDLCTRQPVNEIPKNIPRGEVKARRPGLRQVAYLTIVNGCDQEFEFLSTSQYQMRNWDGQWVTISAGESAQFEINFIQGLFIRDSDTRGEAYFRIKNTGKQFHISTHFVPSLSPNLRARISYDGIKSKDTPQGTMFDLGFPTKDNGNTLQWVLTGSEKYGYWSSANPPVTYLHSMLDIIGERKLKYVTMIGSHDAGMSVIDGSTAFSTWQNTQTQWLDIYGQLVRGSRWFDIRPCLGNNGKHMTCHYFVSKNGAVGSNGLEVDEVIMQINKFMDDFPGELIIVDLNSDCGFDTDHRTPEGSYNRLTDDQWRPIWQKWRDGIKKPCKGFGAVARLDDLTMNQLIGDGQGCVISLYHNIPAIEDASKGFYGYNKLNTYNKYAETDDYEKMRADQLAKLQQNRKLGKEGDSETKDGFFILSWTLTMGVNDWITPLSDCAAIAQSSLFWSAYHEFTPYSYPNIIYVDFVGQPYLLDQGNTQTEYMKQTGGHLIALAIAVNLQIASQNCHVGGGKI